MRSFLLVAAVLSGVCSALLLGGVPSGPFAAWSAVVGWAAMACSAITGGAVLLWPWFRRTFGQKSHAVAAIGGWGVLLLLCAPGVPLWAPLVWGVTGLAVLRPRWVAGGDKRRLYGFGIWLGFAYAWPYVLQLQKDEDSFNRFMAKALGNQ